MAKEKYQKAVKGQVLNRSQAASFFGVAPTTVDQWINAGCPYISKAKVGISGWEFDSAALIEWHIERLTTPPNETKKQDNKQSTLDQAKIRKTEAEAAIAEINLKKMQDTLVDLQEVLQAGMESYSECKAVLLNIPSRLASKILTCDTPEQARYMLDAEIWKALKVLGTPDEPTPQNAERQLAENPPTSNEAED